MLLAQNSGRKEFFVESLSSPAMSGQLILNNKFVGFFFGGGQGWGKPEVLYVCVWTHFCRFSSAPPVKCRVHTNYFL